MVALGARSDDPGQSGPSLPRGLLSRGRPAERGEAAPALLHEDKLAAPWAAECEVGPSRAREIATGRTAVVVTAGPIDPVAPDEVWVTVVQRWSRGHSYKREYRVVRDRTRWISLGPIFKGTPA